MKKKEKKDKGVEAIRSALSPYLGAHPKAKLDVYRKNPVSIRVRIVDPDFAKVTKGQRHDDIWSFLEPLPEELLSELSLLLLLTPEESTKSIANLDFDHPLPSAI
ncbi:MAG: hypothetical protein U0793_14200 [Gemmataceae bacterium]